MSATYQRAAVHSVDDLRAIVDATGSHYFDRDTMRFFDSRLLEGVWAGKSNRQEAGVSTLPGNRYVFVTSERPPWGERRYSVRVVELLEVRDERADVRIETAGEFYSHPTARAARMAAQLHAADL